MLAYIAFALAPITRQERVDTHKDDIFNAYDDKLQAFLDFVSAQYLKDGISQLDQDQLTGLVKARYYTIEDGVAQLGGIPAIKDAFVGFQQQLYGQVSRWLSSCQIQCPFFRL